MRRFIFLVFLTFTHLFYQHETIFVGYFWIVTNTFKIYFWDVSRTSQNHLFENFWDALKTSHKKHLFWDVFETSYRGHKKDIFFEMYLRHLKDVSTKTSFLRCIWDVLKRSQKKTSFFRCIWDVLKASQKRRLFWDVSERSLRCLREVFEMSLSMEIWLGDPRGISCRLGRYFPDNS